MPPESQIASTSLSFSIITTMETIQNPSAPEETPTPSRVPAAIDSNRLSMPPTIRMSVVTTGAFLSGMALGITYGMKTAGLRFRAENAHRIPHSSTGWYLYHKSKNYHVVLGGVKEGLKMGSKISFLTGGFFVIENAVDRMRGNQDFLSSLVAGLAIAGGFSAWSGCHWNLLRGAIS